MKLSSAKSLPESNANLKFNVHFLVSDLNDEEIRQTVEILYRDLLARGLEVLLDDRNEPIESKQSYAELLAIPVCLLMDANTLSAGHVRAKSNSLGFQRDINVEDTPEIIAELAKQI